MPGIPRSEMPGIMYYVFVLPSEPSFKRREEGEEGSEEGVRTSQRL